MAKPAAKNKAAGGSDKGVKVTSRPASFRRAGYTFSSEARVIALSELSEEQLEQITNETMLVAQLVDIDPAPEADLKAETK